MKAALKMEERAGIRLDPTYTAKTFAAVMDFMEQEAGSGATVLYWHTYNSRDLGAEAVGVDYRSLPGAFHGYFESAAPEPKV
jgi:hypothetical protein